jgi:hypothetical protein
VPEPNIPEPNIPVAWAQWGDKEEGQTTHEERFGPLPGNWRRFATMLMLNYYLQN